jgi:hypothetical protein
MKLSTGWNPYFMGEDSRLYTPLKEVAEKYIEETKRNTRPDTCRSYTSFVNIFSEWLEKVSPNVYSSMVTHALVAKFMDYVYNERKGREGKNMSNKTYNNYIKVGRVFFSWMIDQCYCKANHFTKMKSKKKEFGFPAVVSLVSISLSASARLIVLLIMFFMAKVNGTDFCSGTLSNNKKYVFLPQLLNRIEMGTAVISHHEYQSIPVMVKPSRPKVNFTTTQYTDEIDFLKSYVNDLKNGRTVENISPSNDPYFLVPENIEEMIEGMEQIANGQFFVVEDPSNIWGCI